MEPDDLADFEDFEILNFNFQESSLFEKPDKTGKIWDIVLIEEGFSQNTDENGYARYYPKKVLLESIPIFEGCRVFAYQFGRDFDHVPGNVRDAFPEGLSKNEIGWVEKVKWTEKLAGKSNGGLTGKFHFVDEPLREKMLSAWKDRKKDFLGFSIDVEGKIISAIEEGRKASRVDEISKVNELTLVTNPAAGGRFERLVASKYFEGGNLMEELNAIFEALGKGRPEIQGLETENRTEEKLLSVFENIEFQKPKNEEKSTESDALIEDMKSLVQSIIAAIKSKKLDEALNLVEKLLKSYGYPQYGYPYPKYGYPYPAMSKAKASGGDPAKADPPAGEPTLEGKDDDKKGEDEKVKSLEQKIAVMESEKLLKETLEAETSLPKPIKEKIRKHFEGKAFKKDELVAVITEEKKTFAELTESGEIRESGQEKVDVGRDEWDKKQMALDLLIDPDVSEEEKKQYSGIKAFSSLKESYEVYTGDPKVTGRLSESAFKRVLEAKSTDYPYALSNAMNRRLAKIYPKWPANWRKIVTINNNVTDFKAQEVDRWGGFSKLTQVTEDSTFDSIAAPYEEKATYTPDQYGGEFYVTRKMIKNDNLRMVRQIPEKASRAANTFVDQFVFDLLLGWTSSGINTATIAPDGTVIYSDAHFNKGTSALSYDTLQTGINKVMEQWEYGIKTTIAEDLDDSETDIDVASGKGASFKEDEYVLVGSEIMGPITNIATDTLTVAARGALDTTAATHTNGDTIHALTDQLGQMPKYLVVEVANREKAEQLTQNPNRPYTADRDVNLIKGYGIEPIIMPKTRARGDVNNWYLVVDPAVLPGIEIGFVDGRETPELLVQDSPTVGDVFKYQRVTYRILYELGGNCIDFRPLYGALPS